MAADGARQIRAESLLNRRVRMKNGHVVGRIQELRVDHRGDRYEVTEYVLGAGGLLERLALIGGRMWGHRPRSLVARWDQLDVTEPDRPRLTCPRSELRVE